MREALGRARPASCWHLLERTWTTKLRYSGVLNSGHASVTVARYSANVNYLNSQYIVGYSAGHSITSHVFLLLRKPLCYSSSIPVNLQASLLFFSLPITSHILLLFHMSFCCFTGLPVTSQALLLLFKPSCYFPSISVHSMLFQRLSCIFLTLFYDYQVISTSFLKFCMHFYSVPFLLHSPWLRHPSYTGQRMRWSSEVAGPWSPSLRSM